MANCHAIGTSQRRRNSAIIVEDTHNPIPLSTVSVSTRFRPCWHPLCLAIPDRQVESMACRPKGEFVIKNLMLALGMAVVFHVSDAQAFSVTPGNAAGTSHIFAQFVDGRFSDGTFYTSALMLSNPSETRAASCAIAFRGFRPTVQDSVGNITTADAFTLDIDAGQGEILTTPGTADFSSGYVTISCDQAIEATVLYAL